MTPSTPARPLVRYTGFIAAALLILIPVAVLVVRGGHWREGLAMYALAGALALVLLLLFAILAVVPRFADQRSAIARRAMLCVVPAGLFISALLTSGRYPPIHDITNNLDKPPAFVTAASERGDGSNPVAINPDAIAAQRESYPPLQAINTQMTPVALYEATQTAMQDAGWTIYYSDPQQGVLEAVATTALMGFKDDIVARVRTLPGGGSALDLRSVSRVGVSDMGANYKRLMTFSTKLQSEAM